MACDRWGCRARWAVAVGLWVGHASADSLAVLVFDADGAVGLASRGEQLGAELQRRGHQVMSSSEAWGRLAPAALAGGEWRAELLRKTEEGRVALARLDLARASHIAAEVTGELAQQGGGAAGTEPVVEGCLLSSAVLAAQGNQAGAREWMGRVARVGSEVPLDPLRHPEEERRDLQSERARVRGLQAGTWHVVSDPPDADVWIDGAHCGKTPTSCTLASGSHWGRVTSASRAPRAFSLAVSEGSRVEERVILAPAYGGPPRPTVVAMLASERRRSEAASTLASAAHYLGVDHVIALSPAGGDAAPAGADAAALTQVRVMVAPPAAGHPTDAVTLPVRVLTATVSDLLVPRAPEAHRSFLQSPVFWAGAGGVAAVLAGVILYRASRSDGTGSLTIGP